MQASILLPVNEVYAAVVARRCPSDTVIAFPTQSGSAFRGKAPLLISGPPLGGFMIQSGAKAMALGGFRGLGSVALGGRGAYAEEGGGT